MLLPLMEDNTWEVVDLTCDNKGILSDVQTKVDIAKSMVEKATKSEK